MNKLKLNCILYLLLISTLVSSCNVARDFFVTKTISREPTVAMPSPIATSMIAEVPPTFTDVPGFIVVTVKPTFQSKEQEVLENRLEKDCVDVNSTALSQSKTPDRFLLYDRSNEITYIKNPSTVNTSVLEDVNPYFIEVSPSRKWIAFLYNMDSVQRELQLRILSSDEKTQNIIEPETIGNVTGISGWLNDDTIALQLLTTNGRAPTLLAINPFASSARRLPPNFPNLYDGAFWRWGSSGLTIYSSDILHVIYPVAFDNTPPRYIIWDMKNEREVNAILTGDLMQEPKWAPNGNSLAVVIDSAYYPYSANEFYSADIDGSVVQLTTLGELFQNMDTKIRSWNWSPDSRHIAFWLDFYVQGSLSEEKLLILDTQTGRIVDRCIYGDSLQISTGQLEYSPSPIWSPDGSSLLIESRYEINESRLILLDLEKNIGYELEKNIVPLGWLITDP